MGLTHSHSYIRSQQHNKSLLSLVVVLLHLPNPETNTSVKQNGDIIASRYKEYDNGLFENNKLYSNSQNKQTYMGESVVERPKVG